LIKQIDIGDILHSDCIGFYLLMLEQNVGEWQTLELLTGEICYFNDEDLKFYYTTIK